MKNHISQYVIQDQILGNGDTIVSLLVHDDGSATLSWSDGVANTWSEPHPSLSFALLRLAALEHCADSDWERGFKSGFDGFRSSAEAFLNEVTL